MEAKQHIFDEYNRRLLALLAEQRKVTIPYIGQIQAKLSPAYILESHGLRTMYPPQVSMEFHPHEFLTDSRHYSSLDWSQSIDIADDTTRAIADLTNLSPKTVEEVISQEVGGILQSLFRGRRVSVFNIGELFVSDESEHLLLLNFEPNLSTLEHLNRPFTPYSETVLKPHVDFVDLPHYTESPTSAKSLQQFKLSDPLPSQTVSTPLPSATAADKEVERPLEAKPLDTERAIQTESIPSPPTSSRYKYLILGAGLACLLLLGWWLYSSHPIGGESTTPSSSSSQELLSQEPTLPDTIAAYSEVAEELPSEEKPAIDTLTITTGRSLYSYAKEYYGQKMFWVYIYIENASIIRDPNKIPKGTKLTIPDLSKFDIHPDMRIAVKEATLWESIIMRKKYTDYDKDKARIRQALSQ